MYVLGGDDWDDFGRLVMAVGLMALIAYLAPAALTLSPVWARRLQVITTVLITGALLMAVIAALAWFLI
ncbi:MAG TPA: hypothetical protein VHG27_09030 [Xanthobacteraceae bacterium]|nr:hypothetical protein [Xanthobacteraceae bacterium]